MKGSCFILQANKEWTCNNAYTVIAFSYINMKAKSLYLHLDYNIQDIMQAVNVTVVVYEWKIDN